jgi:peptidylprolyl isomerase
MLLCVVAFVLTQGGQQDTTVAPKSIQTPLVATTAIAENNTLTASNTIMSEMNVVTTSSGLKYIELKKKGMDWLLLNGDKRLWFTILVL